MSEATRSGQASEWEAFPDRGKARLKVGGKAVWVWATRYQSDEENPIYTLLREAVDAAKWVKVTGKERTINGAKGPYTSFDAYDVQFLESDVSNGNGSTGKAGTPVAHSAPPSDDKRQATISAQWAINASINISLAQFGKDELAARGITPSMLSLPIEEKAKYLLALSRDLIAQPSLEEAAQGNPSESSDDPWHPSEEPAKQEVPF